MRVAVLTLAMAAAAIASLPGCRRAEAAARTPWPQAVVSTALESNLTDICVRDYDPALDYFPDKVLTSESTSFRVSYHKNYKLLEFLPQIGSHEVIRYALVQCGTPVPSDLTNVTVVNVPVRRFVSAKVEVADVIARLGIVDRLVGVSSMRPIVVPEILAKHATERIEEVGTGTHSTIELAMAVVPDIVFTFYSAFADSNIHQRLAEAGVIGVPLGDHFEPTALGRSEWMKFMALFFNVERRANEEFEGVRSRYRALQQLTVHISDRPAVILGAPSSRTRWGLNGGRNYLARMVEDAGGRYVWNTDSMRSLDLADIEQIYDLAGTAAFWIVSYSGSSSLNGLVNDDPRMRRFGPVANRGVYNGDKDRTSTGGYRLANETVSSPDVLLADLIHILHPSLLPGHELAYHYRLP